MVDHLVGVEGRETDRGRVTPVGDPCWRESYISVTDGSTAIPPTASTRLACNGPGTTIDFPLRSLGLVDSIVCHQQLAGVMGPDHKQLHAVMPCLDLQEVVVQVLQRRRCLLPRAEIIGNSTISVRGNRSDV